MIWELPMTLNVKGVDYAIRTDFRDIINILIAFDDDELEDVDKMYVCLNILYEDFEAIPESSYEEAYRQAIWFIDGGQDPDTKRSPRTMDWEQDAPILFPAVNRVAGFETRSVSYLHWWTFTGFYMEIKDTTYATVLTLRSKKARGEKLEKWESKFWATNKKMCVISPKLTEEEKAEKAKLEEILRIKT